TWDAAVHQWTECRAAAIAAPSKWREVGPVARRGRFWDVIDGRHDDDQRAGIGGVLDFLFVGVRDPRARDRFRIGTCRPHLRHFRPVFLVMLHLGPDEAVARIRDGALD